MSSGRTFTFEKNRLTGINGVPAAGEGYTSVVEGLNITAVPKFVDTVAVSQPSVAVNPVMASGLSV